MEPIHRPTKEEWAQFDGKKQWDIQVALRGPDCTKPESIKWFSTAVLRGVMQKAMRVGGTVNEDLRLIILPQAGPHGALKCWAWSHFSEHVRIAAHWLEIPVILVPWHTWWDQRDVEPPTYGKGLVASLKQELKTGDKYTSFYLQPAIIELKRHLLKTWNVSCLE